jgi:hypothetical protein
LEISSLKAKSKGMTFDIFNHPTMPIDIGSSDPGLPGGHCPSDKSSHPLDPMTTIGCHLFTQEVMRSMDDVVFADEHSVMWDGRDTQGSAATSGIYLHSIMTDTYLESVRMTLVI